MEAFYSISVQFCFTCPLTYLSMYIVNLNFQWVTYLWINWFTNYNYIFISPKLPELSKHEDIIDLHFNKAANSVSMAWCSQPFIIILRYNLKKKKKKSSQLLYIHPLKKKSSFICGLRIEVYTKSYNYIFYICYPISQVKTFAWIELLWCTTHYCNIINDKHLYKYKLA